MYSFWVEIFNILKYWPTSTIYDLYWSTMALGAINFKIYVDASQQNMIIHSAIAIVYPNVLVNRKKKLLISNLGCVM